MSALDPIGAVDPNVATEVAAAADAPVVPMRGRRQWPLPKQADPSAPLLDVRDLAVHFTMPDGAVQAVRGVDFRLDDGEALGIAGESGCGKTTTALSLVRLLPTNARIVSGQRGPVRHRPRAQDRTAS